MTQELRGYCPIVFRDPDTYTLTDTITPDDKLFDEYVFLYEGFTDSESNYPNIPIIRQCETVRYGCWKGSYCEQNNISTLDRLLDELTNKECYKKLLNEVLNKNCHLYIKDKNNILHRIYTDIQLKDKLETLKMMHIPKTPKDGMNPKKERREEKPTPSKG